MTVFALYLQLDDGGATESKFGDDAGYAARFAAARPGPVGDTLEARVRAWSSGDVEAWFRDVVGIPAVSVLFVAFTCVRHPESLLLMAPRAGTCPPSGNVNDAGWIPRVLVVLVVSNGAA